MKRYEPYYMTWGGSYEAEVREKNDGEFVYYDEAEAELARLRAENVAKDAEIERLKAILADALEWGMTSKHFDAGRSLKNGEDARAAISRAEQAKPETCVDVEKIDTAIAEALGEAYDCTRVWEAWGYGAMRSDDFVRVSDDPGRIMEIRDAVLKAMGTPEQEAKPETCVWNLEPDPDEEDEDIFRWRTACGAAYQKRYEGLHKYCPFCGKRVEVKE